MNLPYLLPSYLKSQATQIIELPKCKGWLKVRAIPDTGYFDLSGAYPFFTCENWSALEYDLEGLAGHSKWVSNTLVLPPEIQAKSNLYVFNKAYKTHYLIHQSEGYLPSSHHRYYARRAHKNLKIQRLSPPLNYLKPWMSLYQYLIDKYRLANQVQSFNQASFESVLKGSACLLMGAQFDGRWVAMHLWVLDRKGHKAYSHLFAPSPESYDTFASYGLYDQGIKYLLAQGYETLYLGGGLKEGDGLSFFKKGWSNGQAENRIVGQILNPEKYAQLTSSIDEDYFPAYRNKVRLYEH